MRSLVTWTCDFLRATPLSREYSMNQRFLFAVSFLLGNILVFGIFNLQVDGVLWKSSSGLYLDWG